MTGNVRWLSGATCALGLMALGLVGTAGQEPIKPVPKAPQKMEVKAAPAKVAVKALAPARVMVPEEVVQQWEQHYGPHMRQLLRTELHFMRLVTQPTKQQFERIAAESEPAIKEALRSLVAGMQGGAGGQSEPRAAIADAVARSVQATLSLEQAARYKNELDERTAARKRLVVMNLVAMIDKLLMLSAEQREKLQAVLSDNWDESWNQTQLLMMGGQYFPSMPDAKITAILSSAQRDIWRAVQKGTVRFGINVSVLQGLEIDDEVWDGDKPPKKPAPAEGGAAPKGERTSKAGARQ